ncbi:MAG: hypothetical protein ACYTF5_07500 [Planctomycetota bacterium]|jgi:hypothetical protein
MKALTSFTVATSVAIALLGSTIRGQSNPNAGLLVGNIGPTGTSGISIRGELYTQDVDNNCKAPKRTGFGLAMAVHGGGTAYDAARNAVWVSDGRAIALQQVANGQVSCQFNATLSGTFGKNYFVSGLAHSNKRKQLIQMEMVVGTTSNSLRLRFYDTSACPPKLLNTTCSFAIPTTNAPGVAHGLAYDEARDLIFFTMSGSGFAGWTSSVNYISYSIACLGPVKPISFPVPLFSQCGGANTPVKAMTYNSCTRILYVTEGTVTLKMDISNLAKPVNLNASTPCCKFNVKNKVWNGLAIVPNSVIKSVGTSCLSSGCPSCSNMTLGFTGGDLALGNQDLAIQITGAPAGGTAGFYISLGNCVTPGLSLPGLCGAIHTPISAGQPLFIGNFSLSSGSGCTGIMKIPTPMPSDRSVCNTSICSQFLIRCPSGGGAGGLTNAIEFRVGG